MAVTIRADDDQLAEKDRLTLSIGLEYGARQPPPRSAIHLERTDHGVLVVAHSAVPSIRDIDDLAGTVQRRVCQELGLSTGQCHIGIGEPRPTVAEAYESYLEARRAAHVSRVVGVLGTIVRHSHLGVYGLLAELPSDRLRRSIHPGLQRLIDHDGANTTLTDTLEALLTNAGDVTRTATHLNVHRASVHYRMRRIEQIADVDLSNGDDRLALHLGIKVAQLTTHQ